MAEKVGSIYYDLDVDKRNFDAGLAGAQASVSRFTTSLGNYFNASVEASTQFAKGLGIVGAGLLAGTAFAVKNAASVEMLRTSFDTLLGSAEKGRDLFTQLQKMANVTPFETEDLAKASQTLLAFGVQSKDLLPILGQLGDVSLGNRDKFNSLALVFGQVASAGKLQGQDLLQLVQLGFNPLQKISQRTGESMGSLRDKMAAGEITFQMVADEFKRSTSEGGQFFKGMEKGSTTLSGLWSTLADNTKILAREMVGLSSSGDIIKGGLLDKLKDGMTVLINYLNDHKPQIMAFFNDGLGWIKTHGPEIAVVLTGLLLPAILGVTGAIISATGVLAPWVLLVTGITMLVEFLIQRFGGLSGVLTALQPVIGFFTNAWTLIAQIFQTLILPLILALWPPLQQLWAALVQLWQVLEPILIPILRFLGIILGTIIVVAIMAFLGALYIIINVLKFVVEIITHVIGGIRDMIGWFGRVGSDIGRALSNVWSAITKPFRDAFDWIKNAVGSVIDKLKDLNPFTRHSPSLVDMVTKGTKAITEQYGSMFNSIADMSQRFAPNIRAGDLITPISSTPGAVTAVSVNISAGMFMGTPGEARKVGEFIQDQIIKIDRSRGENG
jgi:tape measure domain-containing protein